MNNKGGVMDAIMGALMFAFGMLFFLVMWGPLFTMLSPYLDNEVIMGGWGGFCKLMILMLPTILTIVGLVLIIKEMKGRDDPYYR